ncbi:MAG TPA: GDSL-type esterase/lipase family protein [Polyangiaceae bacterium]|nr:GDSL-type esterase/lipase family protein [Polyangiaceae bacterium]
MRKRLALTLLVGTATVACVRSHEAPSKQTTAAAPLVVEAADSPTPPTPDPFFAPSPLLSRGKTAVGRSHVQFSDARYAFDDNSGTAWTAGHPTPADPAWLAIDVGVGPTRVLVSWSASGSFDYEETTYGSPGSYRLETSADSTDGASGTWTTVVDVPHVVTHGAVHAVPFMGQRWLRFVVTGAPDVSPNGVQIDEVALYDASASEADTWFFMGDSITATAFGNAAKGAQRFASIIHSRHAAYFPVVVNGGIGFTKSGDGAARVDEWIARNADAHFWAIGYGTNDAAGNERDTTQFRRNLVTIVDRLQKAHRVPILATIPYATDGQHATLNDFNRVIEELRDQRGLPRGPDLYAWFLAHPDELRDGLHPNERGAASMNRLWADAVDALYPR